MPIKFYQEHGLQMLQIGELRFVIMKEETEIDGTRSVLCTRPNGRRQYRIVLKSDAEGRILSEDGRKTWRKRYAQTNPLPAE